MIHFSDRYKVALPLAQEAQFHTGQLVKHKRYGYRGVVVAFDMECEADEKWYQSNQSKPERNQPWYHVLVDGTMQNTYAAETNLSEDTSVEPITHPLVPYFFEDFEDGGYIRNKRPWPDE